MGNPLCPNDGNLLRLAKYRTIWKCPDRKCGFTAPRSSVLRRTKMSIEKSVEKLRYLFQ